MTAWTDEPLTGAAGDSLDRRQYAAKAAELIAATHSPNASVVFGLAGSWGSGKTSVVNMLVEHLESISTDWAIARFTPWATSDTTGLLSEFHAAITEALPKRKRDKFTKALATTAGLAAPAAAAIPYGGGAAAAALKAGADRLNRDPSWQKSFSKASAELKKLGIPILVVVDDIDRLHGDELAALLKVVRLLGRFDGVSYLLAYDEETLLRTVATHHIAGPTETSTADSDAAATLFLEKIVQYPLAIPPLLEHQAVLRLNRGLAPIINTRTTTTGSPDTRRISALVECFTDLLRTPRAIDRYVAQLRHHLPLLDVGEIDDEDVQLLTLLRVALPHLYHQLPKYRRVLVSGHTGELQTGTSAMPMKPFDPEPLLDVVPSHHQQTARLVLQSLFPKVAFTDHYGTYPSESGRGVGVEEYFDRYFAMGIVTHDVSDAQTRAAVLSAAAGDPVPLTHLLTSPAGADSGRQLLAIAKCTRKANQPSANDDRVRLATAVASIALLIPDEFGAMSSAHSRLVRWTASTIAALDNTTPAAEVNDIVNRFGTVERASLWRDIEHALRDAGRKETPPVWADEVRTMVLDEAVIAVIANLAAGDAASTELGIGFVLHYALDNGRAEQIRQQVHQLLADGAIALDTLASRLVGIHGSVGVNPTWYIDDDRFDQNTYNELAPPGDHPWYHEAAVPIDPSDLKWANRRLYATGRVISPPAPPASAATPPPSPEVSGAPPHG